MSDEEAAATGGEPPALDPLFHPRWTRILLHEALSTRDNTGQLDIASVVEALSRAEPLARLPRLWRQRTGGGMHVLLDLGEAMRPFAEDQYNVVEDIKRVATAQAVTQLFFRRCPSYGVSKQPHGESEPYLTPPYGTTILLLSDVGAGSDGTHEPPAPLREWLDFSQRVRKARCRLVALTPYSRGEVAPALHGAMAVIPWDRTTTTAFVRRIRLESERELAS